MMTLDDIRSEHYRAYLNEMKIQEERALAEAAAAALAVINGALIAEAKGMYIFTYMCLYLYMYMYIYIYVYVRI
jgi:hypothetical protein